MVLYSYSCAGAEPSTSKADEAGLKVRWELYKASERTHF
jgi:hypothetical protein